MAPQLQCSFCSRSETEVRKLVAGGGGGHICDQCVAIAARIMEESDPRAETRGAWERMRARLRTLVRGRRSQSLLRATEAA